MVLSVSVRFEYEYHDHSGQWWRAHGNEVCPMLSQKLIAFLTHSVHSPLLSACHSLMYFVYCSTGSSTIKVTCWGETCQLMTTKFRRVKDGTSRQQFAVVSWYSASGHVSPCSRQSTWATMALGGPNWVRFSGKKFRLKTLLEQI